MDGTFSSFSCRVIWVSCTCGIALWSVEKHLEENIYLEFWNTAINELLFVAEDRWPKSCSGKAFPYRPWPLAWPWSTLSLPPPSLWPSFLGIFKFLFLYMAIDAHERKRYFSYNISCWLHTSYILILYEILFFSKLWSQIGQPENVDSIRKG